MAPAPPHGDLAKTTSDLACTPRRVNIAQPPAPSTTGRLNQPVHNRADDPLQRLVRSNIRTSNSTYKRYGPGLHPSPCQYRSTNYVSVVAPSTTGRLNQPACNRADGPLQRVCSNIHTSNSTYKRHALRGIRSNGEHALTKRGHAAQHSGSMSPRVAIA
jgi:hypothetical protein